MTSYGSMKRSCEDGEFRGKNKNPRTCDDARHVMLKMLCPNDFAGSVIGRGGSNMTLLRSYGGMIHVSKTGECYPDLLDRIIIMSGSISTVIAMIDNIVKLMFEHRFHSGPRSVSFPLPQASAGVIIGKNGGKLKDMREKYGCKIMLRHMESVADECMFTIISEKATTVVDCISEVLNLINCGDSMLGVYQNKTTMYPTPQNSAAFPTTTCFPAPQIAGTYSSPATLAGATSTQALLPPPATPMSIQMRLPAEYVPCLLTDKGLTLNDIAAVSRAVIQVSEDPGNPDRVVTILGTPFEVQIAQAKIMSKITGQ